MITIKSTGSFKNTERYLGRVKTIEIYNILNKYGDIGVQALAASTPRESGETSDSWYYSIHKEKGYYSIRWHNRNTRDGIPIAVLLQYGHGTRNGGYVQGEDYIMPAMRPLFDRIANEAWKEVTKV